MKSFLLTLSLLVSTLSFAAEVKIYEAPAWINETASAEFAFNEELGRVWVNIHISDRYDAEDMGKTIRTHVLGLAYDASAKAAFLDIDGQLVECAVVKQRGVLVFRHNYLKASGCTFKAKNITREVDNGFEIEKRRYLQVFLITKE